MPERPTESHNPAATVPEAEPRPVSPQLYVADLAAYNNGLLHGRWLDATQDVDELSDAIAAMLAASPLPGGEEWAIHDYEGFGTLRLGESEPLERISRLARGIAEHGPAFAAWANITDGEDEALANFESAYLGRYESVEAWVEELLDDLGIEQWLDENDLLSLRPYIQVDLAGVARDMQLNGDIHTMPADGQGVWVFDGRT